MNDLVSVRHISIRQKLHFSKHVDLRFDTYQQIDIKPFGVWYSWGGVWADYLAGSKWGRKRLEEYKCIFKIKIQGNVFRPRSQKEFIQFTERYGVLCSDIKPNELSYLKSFQRGDYKRFKHPFLIDWFEVSKDYDGIDIRFNRKADELFYWYNGWDLSSGCIWNESAIAKRVLIYPT